MIRKKWRVRKTPQKDFFSYSSGILIKGFNGENGKVQLFEQVALKGIAPLRRIPSHLSGERERGGWERVNFLFPSKLL